MISKVVERVVGKPLIHHLQLHAFGSSQWAFTKGRSARDLSTLCVCRWLLHICSGSKIGIYLSDISGAFDRVFKEFLIAKLQRAGIGEMYLKFLNAYLEPRVGRVAVAGIFSELFELSDNVFQGTVLGPTLWNTFFADVSDAATLKGGQEELFADDLHVTHIAHRDTPNEAIYASLAATQRDVHKWGRSNRVQFDESKEHYAILHPFHGEGDTFKLLGNLIDCKLCMEAAISHILSTNRPKITAMLRLRGKYSVQDMIVQYKTHIWGHSEYQNGCICHAAKSLLDKLDSMQRRFVHELHLTEEVAFIDHNFPPPGAQT